MTTPQQDAERRLLTEFTTYDQHVDVVSAFEWVFTDPGVKAMPATVAHFERFPTVMSADGTELTPDFTVVFTDGTAIIGEIAKIALPDESVDGLCEQVGKYATVTAIPDGSGGRTTASHVDVLYLVPMATGNTAYRRIIVERYNNPNHPYSPPEAPCIVQFAREESGYTFQRLAAEDNGTLDPGSRTPHIQTYLDRDFRPTPTGWVRVKVRRPFINDPIPPLYLATLLWTRTWPDQYGRTTSDITVTPSDTAEYLRQRYGHVRAIDVRHALELLDAAGLAAVQPDGTWTVSRSHLTRHGEKDVQKILAGRATGRARRVVPRPARATPPPAQGTLFDP